MPFSDRAADAINNALFGKTSNFGALATAPAMYVALLTVIPTPASTGVTIVEATYTGYARKSTVAADWNTSSGRITSNANTITFAQCTAGSSTVNAWALVDASGTGAGNLTAYNYLTTQPQTISTGNITRTTNTASVTLATHGFSTGDFVLHSGIEQAEYNGWQLITVVDANTYTFTVPNTPVTPATAATGQSMTAAKQTTLAVSANITPQFAAGQLGNGVS